MAEEYAYATVEVGSPEIYVETGTRYRYRPEGGPEVDDIAPGRDHVLPLPREVAETFDAMAAGGQFTAGTEETENRCEKLEEDLDRVLNDSGFWRSGTWFFEDTLLRADLETGE